MGQAGHKVWGIEQRTAGMTGIAQPAEANVDELDGAKGGSGTDGSMEFDPAVYRCVVFVPSQFPSVGEICAVFMRLCADT